MQSLFHFVFLFLLFTVGCKQGAQTSIDVAATNDRAFTLDSAIKDTVHRHIKYHSNKYFASFVTPAELRFFSGGALIDSVIDTAFRMISWYSAHNDSVDLVAHVGEFETEALLVRFLKGRPSLYYLRAPHERQKYFRLRKTDSFSDHVEVPLASYQLRLSGIPDTIQKPFVFGSIEMESGAYFDWRDSLKEKRVQMKFYFFSQFRRFGYPQKTSR